METNEQALTALISPKQVEAEFGISMKQQNHLRGNRHYKKGGKQGIPIPFYKILGLGIRYKRGEIAEWIEKQRVV